MCGLTGVFHYRDPERPVDDHLVRRMARTLTHRGPDGEGVWTASGIGLGHRRLAILDLSQNARQPMTDSARGLTLVYNGEVYNFSALRAELETKGHCFRSSGDTEVVLAGYAEWGRDVVHRLSGMFAFAIWDARRRLLFLARDPMGIKPLFYSIDDRSFRFGSEIKAILADPDVRRDLDVAALNSFFTFGYTPAPSTGFRAVRQLLPGHAAVVTDKGFRSWRYCDSPFARPPAAIRFETAVREFEERLQDATRRQLVADVPVGCFLSGGLDSAALVRAAKRVEGASVRALCVGFDVPGFDERPGARRTATALEVGLREVMARLEATELLPTLSRHLEEPTADSSALPVYLLCEAATERFKVALSGDGADELLAGYDTYRATLVAERYRRLPVFLRRRVLGRLAARLPVTEGKYSARERATRFVTGVELGPDLDHCAWRAIFLGEMKRRLYSDDFRSAVRDHRPFEAYADHIRACPASRARLDALLKADTEFYLPNDMLAKVDRMSMAHGLEVRVPFLDLDMARFCAALPADFKLHRGRVRKHILRESLRPSLPKTVLDAPKSGFNAPVARWFRGALGNMLLDSVAAAGGETSVFLNRSEVEKVLDEHRRRREDHGYALFTVLMFALWLDNVARAWKPEPRGSAEPRVSRPPLPTGLSGRADGCH